MIDEKVNADFKNIYPKFETHRLSDEKVAHWANVETGLSGWIRPIFVSN